MGSQSNEQDEEITVVLNLDEGDVECQIISIYECGDKDYIALLPLDEKGNPKDEVYIYRYTEDKDGNPGIEYIEDEEEYEAAADKYDELLDEEVYEELVEEGKVEE